MTHADSHKRCAGRTGLDSGKACAYPPSSVVSLIYRRAKGAPPGIGHRYPENLPQRTMLSTTWHRASAEQPHRCSARSWRYRSKKGQAGRNSTPVVRTVSNSLAVEHFPNDMDNKQISFKPTNWRQQWTSCVAQLLKNPKHLLDLQKLVVDFVAVTKAAAIPVDGLRNRF